MRKRRLAKKNDSLLDWLAHVEGSGGSNIRLGLDRVRAVYDRLGISPPGKRRVVVAGTNGKGGVIARLQAGLIEKGHSCAAYTSPHLVRFAERLLIDGKPLPNAEWCRALAEVEGARAATELTYFEWVTLAAFVLIADCDVDVALLEIGMGGRLDAVNVVDADVAVVTSIGLDHEAYLGSTRSAIAVEKAGIAREGKPCLIADSDPPSSLERIVVARGGVPRVIGRDFHVADGQIRTKSGVLVQVPADMYPHDGAALASLAVSVQVFEELDISPLPSIRSMADTRPSARMQRLRNEPEIWVDVAHNPAACERLAALLDSLGERSPCHALFGAFRDKQVTDMVRPLVDVFDFWHLVGVQGARGLTAEELRAHLPEALQCELYDNTDEALHTALGRLPGMGRLVIFGSFATVGPAIASLGIAEGI